MANPKGNPQNLKSYKPKWKSGKTQTFRFPTAIATNLIEAARELDENGNQSLLQVIDELKKQNQLLKKQLFTVTSKINEHEDSLSSVKPNKRNITVTSDLRLAKVLGILKHGITPKRQGGAYTSNNSKLLKEEVLKAIVVLEKMEKNH